MISHQDLYGVEWKISEKLRLIKVTVDEINELRLERDKIEMELKGRNTPTTP